MPQLKTKYVKKFYAPLKSVKMSQKHWSSIFTDKGFCRFLFYEKM